MLVQLKRFSNRFKILCEEFKRDFLNFPINITLTDLLKNITSIRGPFEKTYNWCLKKRDGQILKYLYKTNKPIFDKYKNMTDESIGSKEKYVWVCWFQGLENAPILVQKCIASIKKQLSDYSVILINENNYLNYVKFSDEILKKFNTGVIGKAHFADILRVNLINTYGGLWIDATIFCSKQIPSKIFEYSFFSCKSPVKKGLYISDYQWTTFLLAGKKNSLFYKFMCDFFESYWSNNKIAIDYLLMDYAIALAKKKIPLINEMIEVVPENNLERDELQSILNEEFDLDKYNELMHSETYLFKLSWRMDFREFSENGKQTFYGYFISD